MVSPAPFAAQSWENKYLFVVMSKKPCLKFAESLAESI